MMSPSSCVLGLWVLALCLMCLQGTQGLHESCDRKTQNAGDVKSGRELPDVSSGPELFAYDTLVENGKSCHNGEGTCEVAMGKTLRCVPADCGAYPPVGFGQYVEFDVPCYAVYTCANVACDDGYNFLEGDYSIQCWFGGWLTDVGANCTSYN